MNLNGRGCNYRGSISIITVLLALPKLLLLPSLAGAFFAPIGVVSSSARSSAAVAGGSAREKVGAARVPPSLGRQNGIFATSEEDFGGGEMSPDAKSTPPPEGGANPLQQRRLSPAAHVGDNESEVAAPVGPAPPAEMAKEAEPALVRVRAKEPPSLWNVPNMLTMARVFAIPVFATVFYASLPRRNVWCAVIFAGAALTDWLDGYIARKQGIVTPFGAFLDPVADKLMVSTALILLSERLGPWMTICSVIILCRELAISALREWMAQLGLRETVKVGNAGKWKTATQMAALSLLLLLEPGAAVTVVNPATFMPVAKGLLYISTILTVTSGSGYLKAAWPALMGRAKQESPP